MITARHSGKIGDIIYAIPAMKLLKVEKVLIPNITGECNGLRHTLKRLMEVNGFEVGLYPDNTPYGMVAAGYEYPTYDFDDAREQPGKGRIHIVKRYLDTFKLKPKNWTEPWLNSGFEYAHGDFTVVSWTGRHLLNKQTGQESKVDWTKVVESIKGDVYFVGLREEFIMFTEKFKVYPKMRYLDDMLDVAQFIAGAKAVYCNQSAILAIAQGLGKDIYCEFKPGKTNCKLYRDNEHELI